MAESIIDPKAKVAHAQMWPREILYWRNSGESGKKRRPADLNLLNKGGVYVLYRDDIPFYIGKAKKLWTRLWLHSRPDARYGLFWNYFTVFVVENDNERTRLESILITAFPTANSAVPRMERVRYSKEFRNILFEIMSKGVNEGRVFTVQPDEAEIIDETEDDD